MKFSPSAWEYDSVKPYMKLSLDINVTRVLKSKLSNHFAGSKSYKPYHQLWSCDHIALFKNSTYHRASNTAIEVIITLWAGSLVVIDGDSNIDFVLDQWIHDCAIDLPKKSPSVIVIFWYNHESIVVQYITVQLIACTSDFTRRIGALKIKYIEINVF